MGPTIPFSEQVHAEKYRGEGESFREAMNRVASALSEGEEHYHIVRDILFDMKFLPGGRIQAAVGSTKAVTPFNCYVSGTIQDSFVGGHGSIMDRAKEAAATMRMGGGIGYDFSTLRPRGDSIKTLQSTSSGAVSFMQIFDAVCRCVSSSGHRRGAQMGVMRIDHPDIEEFIRAKQNSGNLTGFNMSVAVTDDFMEALLDDRKFALKWDDHIYRWISPSLLWENLMRSTWDWGEPGVIFIDIVNKMNNLHYCETIAATNPCGEQPLPPHGACLLGSFNLVKYLEGSRNKRFNFHKFGEDVYPIVRAMDNVIDIANYPLPQQRTEALNKRRMGLGITGLANTGEACGFEYGSPRFLDFTRAILIALRDEAYMASTRLSEQKGSFPLYNEYYLNSKYIRTLPHRVIEAIRKHGIRNSHLISIAPTGTISLTADNVSSSIEPVFAYEFTRTAHTLGGVVNEKVEDYGVRELGHLGKTAKDVTIDEHLAVLSAVAPLVDSAVSKTCNVPVGTEWEDFKSVYVKAWQSGCKGCTTFTTGGKRVGVLVEEEGEGSTCYIDLETGRHECE
jgi:ribonucleoside-diphosphate reductase alpha chain